MLGLGAVAVIAVAGVTIFLVTQPPAAQQQATGAIGAAERYRAEQIKEGDAGVTAPGTETMPVTEAELAEVLGRSADGVRVAAVRNTTDENRIRFLGSAAMDLQARFFGLASRDLQVAGLARLEAREAADLIGRLQNSAAVRFVADWKAAVATGEREQRLAVKDAFDRVADPGLKSILAVWPEFAGTEVKANVEARAEKLARAESGIRDRLLAGASDHEKALMFDRLGDTERLHILAMAPNEMVAEAVSRCDAGTRERLVGTMSKVDRGGLEQQVVEARVNAARLGNSATDLQLKLFDAADLTTKTYILTHMSPTAFKAVMERLDQNAQARFFKGMNAQQMERLFVGADRGFVTDVITRMPGATIRAFDRQDATARRDYLAAMQLSADAWGRMKEPEQIAAIRNLDPVKQVALVGKFSAVEKQVALDGAKPAELMNLAARDPEACAGALWTLDAKTREAFIAAASPQERLDAISKSDLARGELIRFAKADDLGRIPEFGRLREREQ